MMRISYRGCRPSTIDADPSPDPSGRNVLPTFLCVGHASMLFVKLVRSCVGVQSVVTGVLGQRGLRRFIHSCKQSASYPQTEDIMTPYIESL